MTEKELHKNLREGDLVAYEYLFEKYYSWLCNYIFKLSGNKALSEDIVQETMISIWEKRKTIVISISIKSYLFKASHNNFLQHVKKEKKNSDLLEKIRWELLSTVYHDEVEAEDFFESNWPKLNELIEKLPPRCQEVFIKNKIQKVKYADIAKEMGISIKTVENQMSKALHFLKENASSFLL